MRPWALGIGVAFFSTEDEEALAWRILQQSTAPTVARTGIITQGIVGSKQNVHHVARALLEPLSHVSKSLPIHAQQRAFLQLTRFYLDAAGVHDTFFLRCWFSHKTMKAAGRKC
jgi:hypothetical protein